MVLFLSCVSVLADVDPPSGALSPLAWAIIIALATALAAVVPALWYRGNKVQDTMYDDLKACNAKLALQEEEILGLLKLVNLQMERSKASKGGNKG